ncbi:transglutaminase domain-containing protein [Clostridium minihomine]|uniref:transglutaminase domain-containing protein n=1 Tax=Clostridium minihomine TaxID=2045012 RepID=UPI001FB3378B|nr:transglutaminase domain-containing protein [Clostridium minihomine]
MVFINRNSWKKRICSFVLSLSLIGSMATMAGAQQGPSLHRETLAFPDYQQSTSAQAVSTAVKPSVLAMGQNEKEAEAAIAQALINGESKLPLLQYQITKDQLLRILNFTTFTNYPQISSAVAYEYTVDSQDIIYALWPKYNFTQPEVAARSMQIEQAAQAALSSIITKDMSELQKIVAVHDYLVLNCSYDTRVTNNNAPHDSFTAYGALVNKVAVCQGYTAAFQLMMQKLGVPSIVVQSTAMNHTWNLVRYEGNWYHVDVTWDDPIPDRPGVVQTYALMQSDKGIMNEINQHYSWDSAGYVAVNTQFEGAFNWSEYRMYHTAVMKGAVLDVSSLSGKTGVYSEFLVKPYVGGTAITVTSSNPAVAKVELVNANDPRGAKYRVTYLGTGYATLLVTTADGGIKTVPVSVKEAAAAA